MATVGMGRLGAGFGALSFSNDSISWRAKFSFITLLMLWGYAFFPTFQTMFLICTKSNLNQHCILALPLFIGLMLTKRGVFMRIAPSVSHFGLLWLFLLAAGWIFALISEINLLQQVCVLALFPAIFMLAFGYKISKSFIFPLSYIFLLLPIGHLLIPKIQNSLLNSVVQAFAFADLPVYWEHQSIRTIHSELNVAVFAHSLTFSLSFLAVGLIYAYCMVFTFFRRLILASAFVLFPFVFMFLGIYLSMRYELNAAAMPTYYGWGLTSIGVFFSLIFGLVLKQKKPYYDGLTGLDWQSSWKYSDFKWLSPTVIAGIIFIMVPLLSDNMSKYAANSKDSKVYGNPSNIKNWEGPIRVSQQNWAPNFRPATKSIFSIYQHANVKVQLFTAYYFAPMTAVDVIQQYDKLYTKDHWHPIKTNAHKMQLAAGKTLEVMETVLSNGSKNILLWHWYAVANQTTINKIKFKLLDSLRVLCHMGDHVGVVVLATEDSGDATQARRVLQQFVLDGANKITDIMHNN